MVDGLVDEDRDLVDFDAVDRDVVFVVAAVRFTTFLVAPLLALVDLEAVDRDVAFLAAPVFAFVDFCVVLAVPLFALVDLVAPLFALVVRPLAVVDRAVPLLDFVDLGVLDLLRDVDALPLDVDFVAISVGSSANSGGYPSALSCFTPAPEQTKQPIVDSVLSFVVVVVSYLPFSKTHWLQTNASRGLIVTSEKPVKRKSLEGKPLRNPPSIQWPLNRNVVKISCDVKSAT